MSEQSPALSFSNEATASPVENLLQRIVASIRTGTLDALHDEIVTLHPADLGDLLEGLSRDERSTVLRTFGEELAAEVLIEVEGVVLEDVLEHLDDQVIADNIDELNSDDAIDLLEDLDEEAKQKILASLPAAKRWAAEDALRYPESSTGRLMAREFVTVPADWNVGQTIDFLRAEPDLPDDFYDIYLVDEAFPFSYDGVVIEFGSFGHGRREWRRFNSGCSGPGTGSWWWCPPCRARPTD